MDFFQGFVTIQYELYSDGFIAISIKGNVVFFYESNSPPLHFNYNLVICSSPIRD
jgi:hypothetical protein